MTEHFPGHEIHTHPETKVHHEAHKPNHEAAGEKSKEHHTDNLHENRHEISRKVEQHAVSSAEMASKTLEKNHHQPTTHQVTKGIKNMTFERNMTRVRKRLSAPSRAFSKAVHQPAIDKVSEVASSTVARPSGLLGGGMFSFGGTLLLLYLTRKYGYEFNYLMFFMLFVLGFIVGATLELIVYALIRRRNHDF